MVDHETWLENVLSVVCDLADVDYQERVWVRRQGPETDSSTEAICRLFDDYDLEGFLAECARKRRLSEDQLEALSTFAAAAERFVRHDDGRIDDAARIANPEWQELRALARRTLEPFAAFDRAGAR